MLRDNPKQEGYTAAYIADWLDMAPGTVRSCLHALDRQGYAIHSAVEQIDRRGRSCTAWICDPDNYWTDEDMLFWEFGKLF